MELVNLFLKLIYSFVPFDQGEFERLNQDAHAWWRNIVPYKWSETKDHDQAVKDIVEKYPNQNPKLVRIKSLADEWWMRAAFAAVFIYAKKQIRVWSEEDVNASIPDNHEQPL